MFEGLRHLVALQDLDDGLFAAEAQSAGLPAKRSDLAATREAAEGREVEAREAEAAAEAAQRQAEVELQDQEALLARLESQQFQVKSNEAYTALLHEMEAAKRAISECETRILEAMVAIEDASQRRATSEEGAAKVRARVEAESASLDARERELAAEVSRLTDARTTLRGGIELDLREQYERIASRRRPAVARVKREICQGCRVNIPPQLTIELLRGERLLTCTHCHRILIPEGGLEQASK